MACTLLLHEFLENLLITPAAAAALPPLAVPPLPTGTAANASSRVREVQPADVAAYKQFGLSLTLFTARHAAVLYVGSASAHSGRTGGSTVHGCGAATAAHSS